MSGARSVPPDREVRPFEPTWLDKRFCKARAKLSPLQRRDCDRQLAELIAALKRCRHPATDPDLARWRPSRYSAAGIPGTCRLVEYRLKGLFRVVAAFFVDHESPPDRYSVVLLVGATLSHDHQRLERLIGSHRAALGRDPGT